jgi:tRNA wybutosine-synthesizing protein 2
LSRATPERHRLAAVVGKRDAQAALKAIISNGALDGSRRIIKKDCHIEIPLVRPVQGFDIVLQEDPSFYRKALDLHAALDGAIPEECLSLLPRGWFILGEVIIVKIHPLLGPYEALIGRALLDYYPRCCSVLADEGISGPLRRPIRRIIVGSKTRTVHKENGVLFHLDAAQVMFSPGNLKERIRMSLLGGGEVVVDMFAGIGYFSVPMAVHSRPKKLYAIELNPNAHNFLCQNIRQNHVEGIVQPLLGDCAKLAPSGIADRVLMGMVQVTDQYLETAISALKPGGVLHYHQTVPSWLYPDQAVRDVLEAAAGLGCRAKILKCHKVKKFSPGVVHAVIDARIDRDF